MLLGRQGKSCRRQLGMEMSLSMPVLPIFLSAEFPSQHPPLLCSSWEVLYQNCRYWPKTDPSVQEPPWLQTSQAASSSPHKQSRENGKSNLKQKINVQALQREGDLTDCPGKTQILLTLKIPLTSSSSWCCRRSCGEKPQRLHSLDFTMIGIYPKGCLMVPCGMSFTDQLMSA